MAEADTVMLVFQDLKRRAKNSPNPCAYRRMSCSQLTAKRSSFVSRAFDRFEAYTGFVFADRGVYRVEYWVEAAKD